MLEALWKKRRMSYQKYMMKQAKYIVNDHATLILLLFVSTLAIGYAQLLQHMTPQHDVIAKSVLSVFFFLVVKFGKLVSLVKEADEHFLRVTQQEWHNYLQQAKIYSFYVPFVVLIGAVLVAAPLLLKMGSMSDVVILLIVLAILKWIGLTNVLQYMTGDQKSIFLWKMYVMPFGVIALAVWQYHWIAIVVTLLWFTFEQMKPNNQPVYDLARVIQYEQERLNHVYRLLSLFVQVPHVKTVIKRRRYLEMFFQQTSKAYVYAFERALMRSTVYLPLVVRLSVVMIVVGVLVEQPLIKMAVIVLGLWATVVQLLPLYQQYDYHVSLQMAPIRPSDKQTNFLNVLARVIGVQIVLVHVVLAIVLRDVTILHSFILSVIVLSAVILLYVKPKIAKMNR